MTTTTTRAKATAAALSRRRPRRPSLCRRRRDTTTTRGRVRPRATATARATTDKGSPSDIQFAGAVAERLLVDAELVEHAEQQVRHRRLLFCDDVTVALQLSRRS